MLVGSVDKLEDLVVISASPVVTFVSLFSVDVMEVLSDCLLGSALVYVMKTVLVAFPVLFDTLVDGDGAMLLSVSVSVRIDVGDTTSDIEVVVPVSLSDSDVVFLFCVFVGSDDSVFNSEVLLDGDELVDRVESDVFVLSM